jgi:hypothetical protein
MKLMIRDQERLSALRLERARVFDRALLFIDPPLPLRRGGPY